ncbi:MAG: beta-hydroxyacyl-ACP dehydratase [Thermoanaerobaculia bacterium]|nr:beta-hydroxyacyl-ACP dehydratase [Thermoanaerobaculia bacterium]
MQRFVLVDRFLSVEPGRGATALKTFCLEDPVFADHFPGLPVVPGVLLTEAMGQTAGWALALRLGPDRFPLLMMVEKAKFRRLVRPGEEIRLEAELEDSRGRTWTARTRASVGGERAAEARLVFHAVARPPGSSGFDEWRTRVLRDTGLGRLLEGALSSGTE